VRAPQYNGGAEALDTLWNGRSMSRDNAIMSLQTTTFQESTTATKTWPFCAELIQEKRPGLFSA
jgi:hypothetical protein